MYGLKGICYTITYTLCQTQQKHGPEVEHSDFKMHQLLQQQGYSDIIPDDPTL